MAHRNKDLFNGSEAKKFDSRLIKHDILGQGGYGIVESVTCGSVRLARKRIPLRRNGPTIDEVRQEGFNMKKLNHRHVVRLVAIYAPYKYELCLLIWPAAVCSLETLLDDLGSLRRGAGDREDILQRLHNLDLKDLNALEPSNEDQGLDSCKKCPLEYLRNVMGCTTQALAYCHDNELRHLDIKPSNVLLKPGRVYLADFGVSRDVSGQDHTMAQDLPGTEAWRAPEYYTDPSSSMQMSDIYSLGLVFLAIATALYGANKNDLEEALHYERKRCRQEELAIRAARLSSHLDVLSSHALVTPPFMFTYKGQETVRPRPVVDLISRMIATNPQSRPCAKKIDEKLSMLGGIHQIYHSACCKRPVAWIEDKWDRKFAAITSLRAENERQAMRISELEGRDKTYEQRLEHERNSRKEDVARLQARLKDAEDRCRQLEADNTDYQRSLGRRSRPAPLSGTPRTSSVSLGLSPSLGCGSSPLASPKPRSTPLSPVARPVAQVKPRLTQRFPSDGRVPRPVKQAETPTRSSGEDTVKAGGESPSSRHSSLTNLASYVSRTGSGSPSRLPLPNRADTPKLTRDRTDSSVASSVFSRQSIETLPTPLQNSPVPDRVPSKNGSQVFEWDQLPPKPQLSRRLARLEDSASSPNSAVPLPSATKSGTTSINGQVPTRPRIPQLQQERSWAEVATSNARILTRV